jgi:hypothetical protein
LDPLCRRPSTAGAASTTLPTRPDQQSARTAVSSSASRPAVTTDLARCRVGPYKARSTVAAGSTGTEKSCAPAVPAR